MPIDDRQKQENRVWNWFLKQVYKKSKESFFAEFLSSVQEGSHLRSVCTPNPEQIMRAVRDPDFFAALQDFDEVLSDGTVTTLGVRWFFKQKGEGQPDFSRITGSEVVEWWLKTQSKSTQPVPTLLIGAYANTAQRVAQTYDLQRTWCFGTPGYSNIAEFLVTSRLVENTAQQEDERLRALIQEKKPKVIFVAYGAPWQELWVQQYRSFLEKNGVKRVVVCGGALDVLAGNVPRPPELVRILGMEWLFRLILEPWRWKRQMDIWRFLPFLWRQRIR